MANRKGQLQVISAKDGAVIDEINRLQDEIGDQLAGGAKTLLDKAIRIGELLTSQKAKTKRGDWKDWVEANLNFTRQTADNYMKCFRNRATLKATLQVLVDGMSGESLERQARLRSKEGTGEGSVFLTEEKG